MSKTISQLVAVFALIIILSPILSSQSPEYPLADTQVYVNPPSISEPVDALFTIDVGIADVVDLGGFDVKLGWDPAVLEYDSHTATPEAVLNPPLFPLTNAADPAAGTYQLAAASLAGEGAGFTGSGTIFSLTLRVAAEGFSDLEFLMHDIADSIGISIAHTTVNGTFDNRPPVTQYELTIGTVGSGTTAPVPGTYLYDAGTVVPVTAVPDMDWMLDYWLLDAVDVGDVNPYGVTMDANHALEAVFVETPPGEYELIVDVSGSGTTDPAPGTYMYGEVTVTAYPDSGWMLDYWLLNGIDAGDENPITLIVAGNSSLTAVFVEIPPVVQYELVIGVVGSGTTDPVPGAYLYDAGSEVLVTAIPDGGWLLDYWRLDNVSAGSANPFTVTMDDDHTLTAVFVEPLPPPVEAGKSPGYWKHQFKVHYKGCGCAQESWDDLVAWTAAINDYYGVTPPDFYGYKLPPVSSMDLDGDGVFEPCEAYQILRNTRTCKALRLGVANWYNWAAGYTPFPPRHYWGHYWGHHWGHHWP